jgi:hypothetical protein
MNTAKAIFHANTRITSADFSDNLLAFPSCGSLFTRLKTALGNWAHTSVEAQADGRLWSSPSRNTHAQANPIRAAELSEDSAQSRHKVWTVASDNKPLNDGWAQIIEHAYQTRFHSNGAQHA